MKYTKRGEEYYFYLEDTEVHEMFIDFILSFKEEKRNYGY